MELDLAAPPLERPDRMVAWAKTSEPAAPRPALAPGGTEAPWFLAGPSAAPRIADLSFDRRLLVGAEAFKAAFDLPVAGAGQIAAYGLATRFGQETFALEVPLPVIDGGHVELHAGPLPDVDVPGTVQVDFWVVDGAGRASNRLSQPLVVQ